MERKVNFAPTVGISSLLVSFAVLCMAVFALLAVATVRADVRLAEKTRSAAVDYYEAECQAQELLARLRSGELPSGVTEENGVYFYSCPISDTQNLQVQVSAQDYSILRWQVCTSVTWEAEETIPVWDGQA